MTCQTIRTNDMNTENTHYQLADELACEHINYLCRLSGQWTGGDIEKARKRFRESNLKFDIETLKKKIEATKNAFKHPA